MPLLALHGTADKLTAPSGSRALIETIPSRDKTLRIYDGYFHDLLHEPNGNGAKVEDDIAHLARCPHRRSAAHRSPIYEGATWSAIRAAWTQAIELGAGIAQGDAIRGRPRRAARAARADRLARRTDRADRAGDYRTVALRPLGLAVRAGGSVLGLSGGGALVTGVHLGLSAGAWLEQPLGPLHLGALAEWTRRTTDTMMHGPLARATCCGPASRYVSAAISATGRTHARVSVR